MRKAILIVLLLLPSSALAQTNYQLTGQELDQQSQLYYYGQRYYDPQVGRITSSSRTRITQDLHDWPSKYVAHTSELLS